MDMIQDRSHSGSRRGLIILLVLLFALFLGAKTIAGYIIDYEWWKEIGQLQTWFKMLSYGFVPVAAAALLSVIVLWIAHARGMKSAGTSLGEHPLYAKIATLAILVVGVMLGSATIDSWTVVRYFGGTALPAGAAAWRDPVFDNPLRFYFFQLPFYNDLLHLLLVLTFFTGILYWATVRGWQLRKSVSNWQSPIEFDIRDLRLSTTFESKFLRVMGALFLFGLAASYYLDRYDMLFQDHGSFLVGVDYIADHITLPLQYVAMACFAISAILVLFGRIRVVLLLILILLVKGLVPGLVNSFFVRPNEISLQKPYIQRHIAATRSAYGLSERAKEIDYPAVLEANIDPAKHKTLLDNVRLWDWRAFHDTVTQIQSLRPYYVFHDTDVDRYIIDGQMRQVLLTPRELDVRQLGDARTRWINSRFIYTHGYGLVMAEANRITPEGLPLMLIQNAPPVVKTNSLKITRPELYYGEVTHEPVYVNTAQPEFNYPAGADNAHTKYAGAGGIPIGSPLVKFAAAASAGDWNLLLTSYLTGDTRMMIHRNVQERVDTAAPFLAWDPDPYLVLTDDGRLMWIVDGYTTSGAHPYSRTINLESIGTVNYMRNSVKATVDAYTGAVRFYVFDPADPIIQAYRQLFPDLLLPESAMPANLRSHTRYPEQIFRTQAELYRRFHMKDPESFYNTEDLWDLARNLFGQDARPEPVSPTYVIATLPGEKEPEFLLLIPFTPRNKDNLIGLMAARCDGAHLGELVFLQLSKQQLILGPMQIEARINQEQTISKDLTLWNQQGSSVVRGHLLTLPIENTFVYIEPIYIQASEARMPQLRKVVVAMGNRLIYTDTYEEALTALYGNKVAAISEAPAPGGKPAPVVVPVATGSDKVLEQVRYHLKRYRDFASSGRWSDAGKELEALETLAASAK